MKQVHSPIWIQSTITSNTSSAQSTLTLASDWINWTVNTKTLE